MTGSAQTQVSINTHHVGSSLVPGVGQPTRHFNSEDGCLISVGTIRKGLLRFCTRIKCFSYFPLSVTDSSLRLRFFLFCFVLLDTHPFGRETTCGWSNAAFVAAQLYMFDLLLNNTVQLWVKVSTHTLTGAKSCASYLFYFLSSVYFHCSQEPQRAAERHFNFSLMLFTRFLPPCTPGVGTKLQSVPMGTCWAPVSVSSIDLSGLYSTLSLFTLQVASADLRFVLRLPLIPHSLRWSWCHCFRSLFLFYFVSLLTLAVQLKVPFMTMYHTEVYETYSERTLTLVQWCIRSSVCMCVCMLLTQNGKRTHTCAHTYMHTRWDLQAMWFTLPTLYNTLIHQKPLSPHTVWVGDCIVTHRGA